MLRLTTLGSRSRRPRRTHLLLLPILTLSLLLTSCGSGEEGDGSDTEADGKIHLTVWGSRDYYIPPDQFNSLMEENPDLVIDYEVVDTDDILQRMLRMRDAGQDLPDVIQDDVFLIEAFKDAELIIPVDEYMATWEEEDPELYDKLLPIVWEETSYDDQHWGMSITANFDILFYNVPWFEEAGVTVPIATFEEVFEAAKDLKQTRPDKVPFSIQAVQGGGVTGFKGAFVAAGTPFDGAVPDLQSEAGRYVIDWYQRMQENELLPKEAIAWGEAETRGAFISGDAGFLYDGLPIVADFSAIPDFAYDKEWGVSVWPVETGEATSGARITSARTWAISSESEHPYEASLVLRYLAETDQLVGAVEQGAVPPRQTEALQDERFLEVWPFFTGDVLQAFIDSAPVPSGSNAGEVEAVLELLLGEIVTGSDLDAQGLADKYQPQLDALG